MQTAIFNDWTRTEILHKEDILNFDFLLQNNCIKHIEDDFYYLDTPYAKLEECYYERKTQEIAQKLNITNIEDEIKTFIKKLNTYNEIKDVADAMMGKIAELRGVALQEIHDEFAE